MGCTESATLNTICDQMRQCNIKTCIRYKCPICHGCAVRGIYAEKISNCELPECVVCLNIKTSGTCCGQCKVPLCSHCALVLSLNENNDKDNSSLKLQ